MIHYWNHAQRAQEHQHRPKYPQQEGNCSIKQPVPYAVQYPALLQEITDVVRGHEGWRGLFAVLVVTVGGDGGVDEEVDEVEEANGEGVAEEGEEEEGEEGDVFQGHHELPVGPEDGVRQGLLDAVGAAQDGRQAGAEEDGGRRHQGRPHDRVPDRLHGQDVLLLVVLRTRTYIVIT